MTRSDDVTVPLDWISEALDEIWHLRQLCAYEAAVRETDLSYARYPKGRRKVAQERIDCLREAARGHAERAVAGTNWQSLAAAMKDAGADSTLPRAQWEAEKPSLSRPTSNRDDNADNSGADL